VTAEEADRIRSARREQGYAIGNGEAALDVGVFYVVQLVPELDPKRVKLRFAEDGSARLAQHRTAAPTAKLLKTWPCKRSWEFTIIDALAAANCRLILNEVYECSDLAHLLACGDQLFALLPDPKKPVELSDRSPNHDDRAVTQGPTNG
jgi:hypothetical protein